jgi:hypothetical protein
MVLLMHNTRWVTANILFMVYYRRCNSFTIQHRISWWLKTDIEGYMCRQGNLRQYMGICPDGLRKTTKIPRSGYPASWLTLEPGTHRIRNNTANHSAATFGWKRIKSSKWQVYWMMFALGAWYLVSYTMRHNIKQIKRSNGKSFVNKHYERRFSNGT